MQFIVTSSALLKNLQTVSGVLGSTSTLPILDNFLFEINKEELTITGSDLETTMKTTMVIKSEHEGKIAIPSKLLLDTLKNLPEQPLTFSVDLESFGIEIASDYGKYKLVGHNGDEYPKAPELSDAANITVPGEIIAKAISKTIFATGNDELRPVMSGVLCQFSTSDLTFVATDAHKLVRYTRKDFKAEKNSSFILPKKPLNLLKNGLKGEEDVKIEYNESNAIFTFNDISLTCRLIDGKFPNYEAVIPNENPNKMTVERNSFLSSIKRVSIFANKTTNQVRFKIAGSQVTISAEDLDYSNEANESLACNYAGEDIEIGFNSKFIIEMLNNIDTKEIVLEMSEPNRAGIILPATSDQEDEDILMLVMPVMLNR